MIFIYKYSNYCIGFVTAVQAALVNEHGVDVDLYEAMKNSMDGWCALFTDTT